MSRDKGHAVVQNGDCQIPASLSNISNDYLRTTEVMGVKRCAHGICKSDSRLMHKPSMQGVFFLRFPKPKSEPKKCDRWIKACSRGDDFGRQRITQDTYVCSLHFVGGKGPTLDHPDPISATARGVELRIIESSKPRRPPMDRSTSPKKRRKELAPVQILTVSDENDKTCQQTLSKSRTTSSDSSRHVLQTLIVQEEHCYCRPQVPTSSTIQFDKVESGTQTGIKFEESDHSKKPICTQSISTQTDLLASDISHYTDDQLKQPHLLKRHLFITDVMESDKSIKFYTGLASLNMLMFLFNWLKVKAGRLTLWNGDQTSNNPGNIGRSPRALTSFEGYLLILVRLRRGLDVGHLSDIFGIAPASVSRYFKTWLEFMSRELEFLISWPNQLQVRSNLPKAFKHFKRTVGIIDCTEFFIQRPSLPSSQRVTWSQYKSHNTLKSLVSISPNGAFTFLSDLWTGSVSDRRIVKESGFLDKLQYGDDVMADRGFLIRDLLAFKGVTLNIPPFAHGRQLSSAAVTKTRRIASARIHVERAIGRLKNYKILHGIIPLKSKNVINRTVRLCAQLCNLDKGLVK